ncbi:MAG: PDZ domain-containing protein [Chloroflexi bacterium]|nr:PDZ domain-containing protein [Chloroflexota bacterium]
MMCRKPSGRWKLVRAAVTWWFIVALAAPAAWAQPPPVATAVATDPVDIVAQSRALQEGYDLLMGRFVQRPDSTVLLRGAWKQLVDEAGQRGAPDPGPAPVLTGDSTADIAAFRATFTAYLTRSREAPPGFIAAHAALRGMAIAVNEGHTYFLDPRQYAEQLDWARGDVRYGGIGARMSGPELTVLEVFANSPAEKSDLRTGDVIVSVDGTSIAGMGLDQTIALIRGPEGSFVNLEVRRRGETGTVTLRVQRAQIALDFVTSRLLSDGVGYVSLRGFADQTTAEQFEQAVQKLTDNGARSLVLDLRGNSGGRIDVGNRLLSHFIPPGTSVYQQTDRAGRQETRSARSSQPYSMPLVVLVDSGSASMAEIFASAIQEAGAGTVVGTTTAGSVAAAQVFPIGDGSAMQVTVMEILSGSGKRLNGVGVTPDEVIEGSAATSEDGRDPVLARAEEIATAAIAQPLPAQVFRTALELLPLAS